MEQSGSCSESARARHFLNNPEFSLELSPLGLIVIKPINEMFFNSWISLHFKIKNSGLNPPLVGSSLNLTCNIINGFFFSSREILEIFCNFSNESTEWIYLKFWTIFLILLLCILPIKCQFICLRSFKVNCFSNASWTLLSPKSFWPIFWIVLISWLLNPLEIDY